MDAIYNLFRDHYGVDKEARETTLGALKGPDNTHFCYTLEDVVRGKGIKTKHRTAIPETGTALEYEMAIRNSPKYGDVVVIFTRKSTEHDDLYMLEHGGIYFSQILAHGGNDPEDTSGCILVNRNRNHFAFSAWGSMKAQLVADVKKWETLGYSCKLRIHNLPQVG